MEIKEGVKIYVSKEFFDVAPTYAGAFQLVGICEVDYTLQIWEMRIEEPNGNQTLIDVRELDY